MSTFVVLPTGEVVGYSVWPYDPLYKPMVGLFDNISLVGHALCNQKRPGSPRIRSRLLVRLARRLGPLAKLLAPVALEGPAQSVWFSFDPGPGLAARLRDRDPTLRMARMEDGAGLIHAGRKGAIQAGVRTVEHLLRLPDRSGVQVLDGYPSLLQAPYQQQLEAIYLDLLGRLPDDDAYRDYQPRLERGAWTLVQLQKAILASQEFKERPLTSNDRVGALITSHLWVPLLEARVPGDPKRPAPGAPHVQDDAVTPGRLVLAGDEAPLRSSAPLVSFA